MAVVASREPLAILAGGGDVPGRVAAAALTAGRPVLILGIEGEAGPVITAYPHHWVKWGEFRRMENLIKDHGASEVVMVGTISHRPSLRTIRLDSLALRSLPKLIGLFSGGDHSVLSVAIKFIESRGFRIVGAHEVAGDLTAEEGILTEMRPDGPALADLDLAFRAAKMIGRLDAGQAAVSINEHIVALEGVEGTDGMLKRVAELREAGKIFERSRAGVVVKCAKPQQDIRVDMPTIGPQTVENAAAAGLAGIGIEAGRVLIVDRERTLRLAKEAGLFVMARGLDEPMDP